MPYEICRLGAGDYEEAIDFINLVFSLEHQPTDFPKLLPVYYQPTEKHMSCHHVVRADGRIRALVGIYPGRMIVGDTTLTVARIGAVSSHPSYRGQGMMKELMGHCMDLVAQGGYDLGYLGGYRHRYRYFGFEKCGHRIVYHFNESNIRHGGVPSGTVDIRPVSGDDPTLIAYFQALHDRQPLRYSRPAEDFHAICLNWKNKLFAIERQGSPAGYIVASPSGGHIAEMHAESPEIALEAIAAFMASVGGEGVTLAVSPLDLELHRRLGEVAERPLAEGVDNWRVLNWDTVLNAFLSVKNAVLPLQEGTVTLGIERYGSLRLTVKDGAASCARTEDAAAMQIDSAAAARLLFGPLPPSFVARLPQEASVMENWCPLPLYASAPDFA